MPAPLFQHRHYCKIAEIIASMPRRWNSDDARETMAEHFADALRGTNPNYSRERFLAAATGNPSNGRDGQRQVAQQRLPFNVGDIVAPNFESENYRNDIRPFRRSQGWPQWTQATRLRIVRVFNDTIEMESADGQPWLVGCGHDQRECWRKEAFIHAELINAGTEIDCEDE